MVVPFLSRLNDSDFQNEWFSIFFYLWARELKLVPVLKFRRHLDERGRDGTGSMF